MYDHAHMTSKDAPKDVSIDFDNNKITLARVDPFGHVYLTLTKGTLPDRFQGAYTSFDLATYAANEYIEEYWKAKNEVILSKKQKKVNGTTESDSGREQLH